VQGARIGVWVIDVLRLRTHGVGSAFIDEAFRHVPARDELTWQECRDIFDQAGGPFSYGITDELRRHGWDAVDLVLDLHVLREAWIREYGPIPPWRDERQAHAIMAIEVLRPRVVIDLNMKTFDAADLRRLRRRFRFIELTIGVANVMKRLDRAFGHDLILTPSEPFTRALRRTGGPPAVLFHHAFDEVFRSSLEPTVRDRGVVISGAVGGGPYLERTNLVRSLLAQGLAEAWIEESRPRVGPSAAWGMTDFLRDRSWVPVPVLRSAARAVGRGGDALDARLRASLALRGDGNRTAATGATVRLHEEFPDRCHPTVFGGDMFRLLERATASVHHEVNGAATSLRLFETTGAGAALVTNEVTGLDRLFEPGTEVLTYRTEQEAVSLVRSIVEDPSLALAVGRAGHARTMRDHTTATRARQLSDILAERLQRPRNVPIASQTRSTSSMDINGSIGSDRTSRAARSAFGVDVDH
jgi:hypothetical protein